MSNTFGRTVRDIRKKQQLSQRELAGKVGVSFTYVSKIENEKLDFGDYPSEELILKLANALSIDADLLMILAKKIPDRIKRRIMERPDAFRKIAELDDETLDRLLRDMDEKVIT
jgi:transcriptional regulator with XRE-family HTH domain